ncbi:MAG: methionyl-tRNA formyltransferase [Desulfosalsimonadaceae bacterium]|nr:methionyl-tRNA formyltransferase [Desulfosalsimonadaceae bacterium]
MKKPINVVFMGTPDFAVPCLEALHDFGCRVSLVVTRPDQPKGRGRKIIAPPVKTAAAALGYPVLQPVSVKTDEFYDIIQALAPDLLVVVAFGHVLPKRILDIPAWGAVNVHASLLPKYRGPAPIQWAIINGDDHTGITTMLLDKGLDTGEMLLTSQTPILPDDTSQTLHDRLAAEGAELVKKTLAGMENATIRPIPQNHALATYAPMLTKKDGHIDWSLSAAKLERLIRGVTPWPGAFTFWDNKQIKIFKVLPKPFISHARPGTVIEGFSNELRVVCGDGSLSVMEIQGSSGKRMHISDFLRGAAITTGTVFT